MIVFFDHANNFAKFLGHQMPVKSISGQVQNLAKCYYEQIWKKNLILFALGQFLHFGGYSPGHLLLLAIYLLGHFKEILS